MRRLIWSCVGRPGLNAFPPKKGEAMKLPSEMRSFTTTTANGIITLTGFFIYAGQAHRRVVRMWGNPEKFAAREVLEV